MLDLLHDIVCAVSGICLIIMGICFTIKVCKVLLGVE